ncbi:MAG: pitrilysin family protein [Candidatus Saganbacteria bacterium]|nr:pitrilysin family protein [Candidatus Saganbacteria bacterium]
MKIPNADIDILENGIKVAIEELPHLRSVSIGLTVGAGSITENKDVMGISHFIEHTTFKGTKKRSAFEIAQALDRVGGRLNAFTGKEYTVYYAVVQDKYFNVAADVLGDIFLDSLYLEKDLDMERNVVLEEIKMYEDTPDEQIHDIFASTILHHHNLGNSILGEEKTVKDINREKISVYRKELYTPDNLIISVAGRIDKKMVLDTLNGIFSSFAGNKSIKTENIPEISSNIKLKVKKTEQAHIILGTKGSSQNDEDRYVCAILDNALGGSMSSRLFQEIREKRALVYSVYSFNQGFKDVGLFGIYAGASPKNFEQVIELTVKELSGIKKNGITDEEMSRAKEFLKGSLVLALETSNSRMNYTGKSLFYYGRIVPIDEIFEKIDSVSMEDIIRIANLHFIDKYLNLVVIGDFKELPIKKISI